MSSKRKKIELICPCCGVTRGEQAKQALLDIELECNRHQVKAWWSNEGCSIQAAMTESLHLMICDRCNYTLKGEF